MITSVTVADTSVTTTNRSPFWDHCHPDDQTTRSYVSFVSSRKAAILKRHKRRHSLLLKDLMLSLKTILFIPGFARLLKKMDDHAHIFSNPEEFLFPSEIVARPLHFCSSGNWANEQREPLHPEKINLNVNQKSEMLRKFDILFFKIYCTNQCTRKKQRGKRVS